MSSWQLALFEDIVTKFDTPSDANFYFDHIHFPDRYEFEDKRTARRYSVETLRLTKELIRDCFSFKDSLKNP